MAPRHLPPPQLDPFSADHDDGPSRLVSGNIRVAGHRTSVRLEPALWEALREICRREGKTLHELVTQIARNRAQSTLTASIRVYLMSYYRAAATEDGHRLAGHGLTTH